MDFKKIMSEALKKGFEALEINFIKSKKRSLSLYKGQIDKNEISNVQKMIIRGLYNNQMAVMKIENFTEAFILKCLDNLLLNAKVMNNDKPVFFFDGKDEYLSIPDYVLNIDQFSLEEKIAKMQTLEKTILAYDSRIAEEMELGYEEEDEEQHIVNTKGLDVTSHEMVATLYASIMVKEKEDVKSSFEYEYDTDFQNLDPVRLGNKVAKKAVMMLHDQTINSKKYPVILSSTASSNLLKAFSPLFNGEMATNKLTPLWNMVGQKIFGDNITLYDEGIKPEAKMYKQFDNEGVPTRQTTIIEQGVFKTLLHNLTTSAYFNVPKTGNGSIKGVAINTLYLKEGKHSLKEMMEKIEDGIYIENFQGLHAGINTQNGDFSLQSSGFHIVNGQIKEPLSLFVASGNFLTMMKEISMIGNQSQFYFNVGSPELLISQLSISSK